MKIHTGIDMVKISRIQRLIENSGDKFLNKHFTQTEIEYCRQKGNTHFAGIFAVKEAVYKALKLKWESGFNWKNIETLHSQNGIPTVHLHGSFEEHYKKNCYESIDVSITYAGDYATAIVTVLQLQP